MDLRTLTAVIHGESGVGKTRLADTAPGPRLFLDAEGGAKFTPTKKIVWNPETDDPPEDDGTWETCIVHVVDFQTVKKVFNVLNSGKHPFKSFIMDSLTELQKRCMDALVGTSAPDQSDWGTLLRQMEAMVRSFRDLTMHPKNPLQSVIVTALSSEKDGKYRPHVQGQLGITLPGYFDVVGYMYVKQDEESGELVRRLLVQPHDQFVAKDRTGRLATYIDNPTITGMIDDVFAEENN